MPKRRDDYRTIVQRRFDAMPKQAYEAAGRTVHIGCGIGPEGDTEPVKT
jgi:hypothetical protein